MMKKLLCVFLALVAAVCLLSVTVSAEPALVLSEDLQTLTLDDRTYSRADLSAMDLYYNGDTFPVQLPQNLHSQAKSAIGYCTDNEWVISVEIYYQDGSRLDIYFAYDEVKSELLRLCQDDELVCGIQLWWSDGLSGSAPISKFKGALTQMDGRDLAYTDTYTVVHEYRELNVSVYRGFVSEFKGDYYYVDYRENNIPNPMGFYAADWPLPLKAYKITDAELIEQIDEALDSQYNSASFSGQAISAFFLCFVFGLIPLAILVLSLIITIRSRGYYRLTWAITAGLCAAELSVFFLVVSYILSA